MIMAISANKIFDNWDCALEEAGRLVHTPGLRSIAVSIHASVEELVEMEYTVKRVFWEGKDAERPN